MRLIYACSGVVCVALLFSACGGGDKFTTPGDGEAGSGAMQGDAGDGSDAGGAQGKSGSSTGGSLVGNGGQVAEGGMDAGGDTGAGGAPTPPECVAAADCDALRGPSPCGTWQCSSGSCAIDSPGCSDDDGDGFGIGPNCACAALDCDDNDDTVEDALQQSCYTGPGGTLGVGTCQDGQAICTAGMWGPCVGEITPGGEACNGLDDDCNGSDDDGLGDFSCGLGACTATVAACTTGALAQCVPHGNAAANDSNCNQIDDDCDGAIDEDCTCVRVSPLGSDATGNATLPFATIQAGINWAASHPTGPQTVCVASGATCGLTYTYTNAASATVTMADGVSVLGKYESAAWTRCTNSTTVIAPQTAAGVTFPSSVTSTTVLDGFRVDRLDSSTTAGVTIDGAKNVILSDVSITNTPVVSKSYGVNIINGAQATVTRGHTDAGFGSVESIGIRAVGSTVSVEDNCLSPDPVSGRCDDSCGSNPSVRGRTTGNGTGTTYAVLLDDAPGSRIQRSALCANDADTGAAIKVTGDATGVLIRGNFVNAFGGAVDSHGIWLEDCGGAAPWIVDNHSIAANGDSQQTRVDSIRAIGDCHPVIDRNVTISGGGEGAAANPTAVHCAASTGVASRCVVDGNLSLRGSAFGFPPVSAGVRCESGSCVKITSNVITGRGAGVSYGVWLGQTGAFVGNNSIRGGCSATATGVYAEDSYARLENNRIVGYVATDCTNNPPVPSKSYGLQLFTSDGPNELDVHSNFIDGGGPANANTCDSWGVALNVTGTPPSVPSGMFRNNILRAGTCSNSRSVFAELAAAADPRIFEHNDLDPTGSPTQLYLDENTTGLATPGAVNALIDMTVFGNISADPQFVGYPADVHLSQGSLCDGAGTSSGAPTLDMDGDARDAATPDIGPDEL